jgi:hypothetical protein
MPFNKNHLSNILFQQSIPLIEYILKDISEKYNLDLEELEKQYLIIFKTNKKRNTNKKGKKNGYSFFLSDKEVDKDLKLRFPDMRFGDLSKEKGKVWRAMSKIDKGKYKEKADNFNKEIMKLKIIHENVEITSAN